MGRDERSAAAYESVATGPAMSTTFQRLPSRWRNFRAVVRHPEGGMVLRSLWARRHTARSRSRLVFLPQHRVELSHH